MLLKVFCLNSSIVEFKSKIFASISLQDSSFAKLVHYHYTSKPYYYYFPNG